MARYGLSKSRLIAWKQCPKRLWLQYHRPDLLEITDETEHRFQIGFEVGEVAQGLHSGGILIEDNDDLSVALASTRKAIDEYPNRPIFEATFQHDGVLVRADLMLPTSGGYRMVEVKSSTSVSSHITLMIVRFRRGFLNRITFRYVLLNSRISIHHLCIEGLATIRGCCDTSNLMT